MSAPATTECCAEEAEGQECGGGWCGDGSGSGGGELEIVQVKTAAREIVANAGNRQSNFVEQDILESVEVRWQAIVGVGCGSERLYECPPKKCTEGRSAGVCPPRERRVSDIASEENGAWGIARVTVTQKSPGDVGSGRAAHVVVTAPECDALGAELGRYNGKVWEQTHAEVYEYSWRGNPGRGVIDH